MILHLLKKKKDIRQLSLEWWSNLSSDDVKHFENKFFDEFSTGDTTDIDIESMYLTFHEK